LICALAFRYGDRAAHSASDRPFVNALQAIRRSAILFWLGLFLNNGFVPDQWRVPGNVRCRNQSAIACKLIQSLHANICRRAAALRRQLPGQRAGADPLPVRGRAQGARKPLQPPPQPLVSAFLCWPSIVFRRQLGGSACRREWLFQGFLILLHLLLTFMINVPGCGRGENPWSLLFESVAAHATLPTDGWFCERTGYLGPGGALLADNSKQNCTGGAAGYVDNVRNLLQCLSIGASSFGADLDVVGVCFVSLIENLWREPHLRLADVQGSLPNWCVLFSLIA
jgi:hypothetical protein